MNKTETRTIQNIIRRLDPETCKATEDIRASLKDPAVRLWLDTWVLAPLQLLVKEERSSEDLGLAERLSN